MSISNEIKLNHLKNNLSDKLYLYMKKSTQHESLNRFVDEHLEREYNESDIQEFKKCLEQKNSKCIENIRDFRLINDIYGFIDDHHSKYWYQIYKDYL